MSLRLAVLEFLSAAVAGAALVALSVAAGVL